MTLLDAAQLESLERLTLATRRRLIGFFSGEHRSPRFGSSLDFADYREYRPGDDFRRIDPALSGRLDRLYMRLFEAEEDVPVRIVVDASASMSFGEPSKARFAAVAAACMTHVTLVANDRARLYAARAGGAETSRWFRGRDDVHDAMRWLEAAGARGGAGLAETVRAIREEGRPGVLVVISDLLQPDWDEVVRRLTSPGEGVVVHVLSPDELDPPVEGDLTLVDAETGEEVEVSVTAETLDAYRRRVRAWRDAVRSAGASRGVRSVFVSSDADPMDLFLRRLPREEILR